MDREKLQEAEDSVRNWMADSHHRRCCKIALGIANGVMLMGLTAGMAMLCLLELRKMRYHHHCCNSATDRK